MQKNTAINNTHEQEIGQQRAHLNKEWTGVYSKPVHLSRPESASAADEDDDDSVPPTKSTNCLSGSLSCFFICV